MGYHLSPIRMTTMKEREGRKGREREGGQGRKKIVGKDVGK